jgi:nitrate/nitrite transport system substrate-binding protein
MRQTTATQGARQCTSARAATSDFSRNDGGCSGASAAGALMALVDPAIRAGAWAQGSDAPEKKEVRSGSSRSPTAHPCGRVGARVRQEIRHQDRASKEASWAAVRDKLVNGELDAAHVLYGLDLRRADGHRRTEEGHGRADEPQHNGQAITLPTS